MLRFVDVSNWQRGMDLAAVVGSGGLAGAVVKATEGVGYVDPSCDGFVRQLREAGALFGFYHFARNNDASAEAEFFRANTVGYEGEGVPVLDWEDGQSVAWVNEFVERYHELTGVWPWIYANPWRFRQGEVNPNCGRWVAGYPKSGITDIDYGISNALPSSYDVGLVCAWQFSSSVRISGYGGNLDGDVFYGDEGAWMAYAGGGSGARLGFADAAAEVMEHLCSHGTHGYSQVNRQGVGTGANVFESITLSDGSKVTVAQGDRDCSSAAIECYAALGVDVGGATYTGNMRRCMVGTGRFKWITDLSQRRRGDILLNEAHHTAVYLGGGKLGQFSISERGTTHGTRGDQTGYESNVKGYYNYPWDGILRYCGPEREEPEPEEPAARGASVQLYDGNATDAQRWAVSWDAEGYVTLTALSCGLALDVQYGGTASGNPVWVYTPNGTDSQKWSVIQKEGDYNPADSAPVELAPKVSEGLRLDCVGGGKANGTGIQVYEANGTPAQEWAVLDHGDGTWTLVNVGSSQALDVVGGGN